MDSVRDLAEHDAPARRSQGSVRIAISLLSAKRFRQRKIGHIRARDQQHKGNRTQQHQQAPDARRAPMIRRGAARTSSSPSLVIVDGIELR